MGLGKSLLKNTLALSAPNILNPLVSFLLVLVISRRMGVEGLGEYSLVLSYVALFSIFASLGLGDLIAREAARNSADMAVLVPNSVVFGMVSSIGAIVCMNGLVAALGYSREVVLGCLIMSLSLPAYVVETYLEAVFRAMERAEYPAFTFFLETVVRVAVCVVLVLYGYGILTLFVVILTGKVLAAGLLFYLLVRLQGKPRFEFRPDIWRMLLGHAPTFAGIAIFVTIHLSIDKIMLSKLKSIDAVGVYSAADRLLDMCKTLPVAFSAALLPFLTKEYTEGVKRLRRLASDSCKYVLMGAFPIAVGTAVLADQIIELIYGARFTASVPVLRLHIVSLIPFSMVFVLAQVLIATDNQKVDLTINVVAALVNVLLNYLLIPRFAEMGAVAATLLTVLMFHQLQYGYIRQRLFSVPLLGYASRIVPAAAAMGVLTFLMRDLNIFLNVGLSSMSYFGLIHVFKVLSPEEILFLKGLVRWTGPGDGH